MSNECIVKMKNKTLSVVRRISKITAPAEKKINESWEDVMLSTKVYIYRSEIFFISTRSVPFWE